MTGAEPAPHPAPATEQIAAAGTAGQDRTSPGQHPPAHQQAGPPASATQPGAGSDLSRGDQPPAQLLADHELHTIQARWKDIQAEFVDEPHNAVQHADALVADLMQRLARMFATEREQLESQWASGNDVSTEDLRHGLRRYRSFFERLLAA